MRAGGWAVNKFVSKFLCVMLRVGQVLSEWLGQSGGMENEKGKSGIGITGPRTVGSVEQTTTVERGEQKTRGREREAEAQAWWRNLSQGERRLICSLMGMLRGAKRSQVVEVARAAAKWERGLGCFIKVRLIHERSSRTGARRRLVDSGWVRIEGRGEIGTGLTVQNPRSAEA